MNNYMVSIDGEVVTIKRLETPLARVTPAETRETIAQKTIERVKRFDPASVPVESPDDWVEITDSHPEHIRRTCDQVCGKTEDPNCWHWVNHTVGYSQHAYPNSRIRCRRKNLPAVESPDDWVEIDRHEHSEHIPRSGIDVLLFKDNALSDAEGRTSKHGDCSKISHSTWNGWKWVCRRKDLPAKQPAAKRVPMRLWVRNDACSHANGAIVITKPESPDDEMIELRHDADGFYVEKEVIE
jgi:antitoxin (DNA-binding transcriptional repressor) of toxin-antitoxin stability system